MKKNINEDITRIKEIMGLLNEVTTPSRWVNFLTKLIPKLINITLEDALIPELKVMEKEGKLTLNKIGNKLESIDFGRLTTEDINILIRSNNFRKMVKEVFDEYLKVDLEKIGQSKIKTLTGDFQKLAQQFFNTKTRIIVQNFGEDAGKNWARRSVSKAIRAITKMQPDWLKKFTDTYNGTITEQIKLEKDFMSWAEQASSKVGKVTIADELKQMNIILLKIRTLGKQMSPEAFYGFLKKELKAAADPKDAKLYDDVLGKLETTEAFKELQERFFNLGSDVKYLPKSTISRMEGYVKLWTELSLNPIKGETWVKLVTGISNVFKNPLDSRVVGMLTMLEPRTYNELAKNAAIKGVGPAAFSYITGKAILLYAVLPLLEAAGAALYHSSIGEDDLDMVGDEKFRGNVFAEEFIKHYGDNYSNLKTFVGDWSPVVYWYFSIYTKKVKPKSKLENTKDDLKNGYDSLVSNVKAFGNKTQKELDDFLIKYPNARSIVDSLVKTGDLKKPEPVTDPVSTVTYETLTSQEVAYYISTNLKGTIPSKTTTNADNSVDVFVDGQIDPIATIIKQNGEVTIK